jgi:hypothetical protein
MKLIKLFEQWVSEEDANVDSPKVEDTENPVESYTLTLSTNEFGDFEVTAIIDSDFTTDSAKAFKVISSNNSKVELGSTIMVSSTVDKNYDSDIVIINDKTRPENSLIYSGKIKIEKS